MIQIGEICPVTIMARRHFGLFVQFADGQAGFIDILHVSIHGERVSLESMPPEGAEVEAVVIGVGADGTYRLSLRDHSRNLRRRWDEYKHNVDVEKTLKGKIVWCREGSIIIDVGAPFGAKLINSKLDAFDFNNEGRHLLCKIVGFNDDSLEIIVEDVDLQ